MKAIPKELMTQFDSLLKAIEIPKDKHGHYKKWLRYYLDFCQKYRFAEDKIESLPKFLNKLKEKAQTIEQQNQASHSVSLFYKLPESNSKKPLKHTSEPERLHFETSRKSNEEGDTLSQEKTQSACEKWQVAHEQFTNEIKLRHYSPKTLKTYAGWIKRFQSFIRSKDTELLSSSEVKDYLTFLAVKCKVSASSQNQAFNALLFFYRHVLKFDSIEIKDVPRAKRRPYIPVVLSREEIDAITENLDYPYDLVVYLLYGCGLRLAESLNIRIHNFNFDTMIYTHTIKSKTIKEARSPLDL